MIGEIVSHYKVKGGCCSRIYIEKGRDFYWLTFGELESYYKALFPGKPIPHHELVYPTTTQQNGS